MSAVVNSKAFLDAFNSLGWPNGNDLLARVESQSIPATVIYAYLSALITTPAGLNDQTISGVTGPQGAAITSFLKNAGLVAV